MSLGEIQTAMVCAAAIGIASVVVVAIFPATAGVVTAVATPTITGVLALARGTGGAT